MRFEKRERDSGFRLVFIPRYSPCKQQIPATPLSYLARTHFLSCSQRVKYNKLPGQFGKFRPNYFRMYREKGPFSLTALFSPCVVCMRGGLSFCLSSAVCAYSSLRPIPSRERARCPAKKSKKTKKTSWAPTFKDKVECVCLGEKDAAPDLAV